MVRSNNERNWWKKVKFFFRVGRVIDPGDGVESDMHPKHHAKFLFFLKVFFKQFLYVYGPIHLYRAFRGSKIWFVVITRGIRGKKYCVKF